MQSPTGSSGEVEEVDLSGLMESVVDSDEDEEEEECDETSLLVRDAVRECLEKDPSDRGTITYTLFIYFQWPFKTNRQKTEYKNTHGFHINRKNIYMI